MPPFQSFWHGENLPPYQRLAMKSFVDCGHDYHLFSYRKFDVPAGVRWRDANEVLPEERVFFYGQRAKSGRGSISAFSNLFRHHLLYRLGGWWVDTDVICLSDKVPAFEVFMGWEDENLIGSAILKFPAGHELARAFCEAADRAGTDLQWGSTGPFLITRLVRERRLEQLASPPSLSYPVQAKDVCNLLLPGKRDDIDQMTGEAPFLHLWNEVLRRAVISTWMAPPPGSFLAGLFEQHGIDFAGLPAYTADQVQRLTDNYNAFCYLDQRGGQLDAVAAPPGMSLAEVMELQGEVMRLQDQVRELRGSTSWRVTRPLRLLMGLFRRTAAGAPPLD